VNKFIKETILNYKGSLFSIFLCIIVIGIIRQLFPLVFGYMIDIASKDPSIKLILGVAITYGCLFLCSQLLQIINNITYADVFNNMLTKIRMKCLESFLGTSKINAETKSTGEVLTIINSDTDKILELVNNCIINLLSMTLECFFVIILISYINWIMCLYVCLCVVVSVIISSKMKKIVEKLVITQREMKSKAASYVLDILVCKKDIFVLNAFDNIVSRFIDNKIKRLHIDYNISRTNFLTERVSTFIALISNLGLMGISCYLVYDGSISMGSFISCTIYFEVIISMMYYYNYLYQVIPEAITSINKVIEFMNLPNGESGNKQLDRIDIIEFNNVTFSYNDNNVVLKNLNFTVNREDVLLIIGASGRGKTTIIKTLTGLYDLKDGNIMVNGINIREFDINILRSHISVFNQNSDLIYGESIKENLCMGKEVDETKIWSLLKKVNMYEYVSSLKCGLDTIWLEESIGISGGQKQRLLIVRTILKKADVYIFDECTSALDKDNENLVKKLILKLSEKNIVIVITHRTNMMNLSKSNTIYI